MDATSIKQHLRQIEAALVSPATDAPTLGRVIATLEQHCEVIPGGEDTWKPRFWANWGALEEVYAVALDRGMSDLDAECQKIIEEGVRELRSIVASVLV